MINDRPDLSMTTYTDKQKVVQSTGTKEDWEDAKHNFRTSLHTHWNPDDHNGMEILPYYNSADCAHTDAKTKYSVKDIKALKDTFVALDENGEWCYAYVVFFCWLMIR